MTMQSWYVKTFDLGKVVKTDRFGGVVSIGTLLANGDLELRTGQWVRLNGKKYQFVNVDNIKSVKLSLAGVPNETFDDRTQRFCRAVWHSKYKQDAVLARLHAPASLSVRELRSAGILK